MTQPEEHDEIFPIVLLRNLNCYGEVVNLGSTMSLVKYEFDGVEHVEFFENEDFVLIENVIIKFETYE